MRAIDSGSRGVTGAGRVLRSGWCWAAVCGVGLLLLTARSIEAQQKPAADAASTVASLQARLEQFEDREAIVDGLQRYIRGIDRHDKELVRSVFWPEAKIDLGTPMGREEYVDREEASLATYAAHQHHITGQTFDIQGNRAHVESYVFFIAVPRDTSGDTVGPATPGRALTTQKTQLGSGRYLELWEKRGGEWKILIREYVHDLNTFSESDDYCARRPCLGRWDKKDLSYQRPLQPLTLEQRKALGEANKKTTAPKKP